MSLRPFYAPGRDTFASIRRLLPALVCVIGAAVLVALTPACGAPSEPGSEIDLTTDCSGVARSSDVCDTSTTRLNPANLPELPCPTRAEVEEIRGEIPVQFNSDVSAGVLACRERDGSVDLTVVENNIYQSLLFLRRMQFDRPLPWTDLPVYEWVRRTIPSGIVVHFNGNSSSCLRCSGPIRVVYSSYESLRPTVYYLVATLIVHEARHAEGYPHTCGASPSYFNQFVRDRSVSEMGGFGVHYLLAYWLGHFSQEVPAVRDYYAAHAAQLLGGGSFCCECRR